jgi:hypothetical protein
VDRAEILRFVTEVDKGRIQHPMPPWVHEWLDVHESISGSISRSLLVISTVLQIKLLLSLVEGPKGFDGEPLNNLGAVAYLGAHPYKTLHDWIQEPTEVHDHWDHVGDTVRQAHIRSEKDSKQ